MKQTFMVVINSDNEIEIGQIGVPIMKALGLETIKVEKAAQHGVQADGAKATAHEHNFENSLHCSVCDEAQF